MSLIIKAAQFAAQAHKGQLRKYTNRPYIEHPMRVAGMVCMMDGANESIVAASWLHDVIEDTEFTIDTLNTIFGGEVARLVQELTNPSKKLGNALFRHEQKQMDFEHLSGVSLWAKIIKLTDRIDNLREMDGADEDFKRLYYQESQQLADYVFKNDGNKNANLCHLRWVIKDITKDYRIL